MKSLHHPSDREAIMNRLGRLSPDSPRKWGRMTAAEMVCHLADSFRVAMGEIPCPDRSTLGRRTLVKWLVIYAPLPIPKGKVETAPEMKATSPHQFDRDLATLKEILQRFADKSLTSEWQAHPAFGKLSGKEWSILGYKHMDHHLQQFGV